LTDVQYVVVVNTGDSSICTRRLSWTLPCEIIRALQLALSHQQTWRCTIFASFGEGKLAKLCNITNRLISFYIVERMFWQLWHYTLLHITYEQLIWKLTRDSTYCYYFSLFPVIWLLSYSKLFVTVTCALQWSDSVWYSVAPIGVNMLSKVVSRLCKMAGFKGYFTNHSLRATAATRLFDADIDEQLIMAKTGHVSTVVRSYKRVNQRQLQNVSDVVACKKPALSDEPLQSTAKAEMSSSLSSPSSSVSSVSSVSGGTFDCTPDQSGRVLIRGGSGNITVNIYMSNAPQWLFSRVTWGPLYLFAFSRRYMRLHDELLCIHLDVYCSVYKEDYFCHVVLISFGHSYCWAVTGSYVMKCMRIVRYMQLVILLRNISMLKVYITVIIGTLLYY